MIDRSVARDQHRARDNESEAADSTQAERRVMDAEPVVAVGEQAGGALPAWSTTSASAAARGLAAAFENAEEGGAGNPAQSPLGPEGTEPTQPSWMSRHQQQRHDDRERDRDADRRSADVADVLGHGGVGGRLYPGQPAHDQHADEGDTAAHSGRFPAKRSIPAPPTMRTPWPPQPDPSTPGREELTLRDVVETLAPIERRAGSDGEQQAAEWIAARLRGRAATRIEEEQFLDGYARTMSKLTSAGLLAGLTALAIPPARKLAGAAAAGATLAIADDISNGPRLFRRATAKPRTTWNVVGVCGDRAAPRTLVAARPPRRRNDRHDLR